MLKAIFPTLGRFRLFVQIAMLLLTVYGSNVVGFYMAEKISNALPALSCAYDQQNGAYCVLIPTQHQLHHRIGEAMVKAQQLTFQMVLPLLFTLLTFFTFFFVLSKAFCGWICPLGTIQELINKLGRKLNLPLRRFENGNVSKVRPVKWLMLLVLVLALPLLTGLGVTPHSLGNPFCDVCPSRIATTLLTGNTEQTGPAHRRRHCLHPRRHRQYHGRLHPDRRVSRCASRSAASVRCCRSMPCSSASRRCGW